MQYLLFEQILDPHKQFSDVIALDIHFSKQLPSFVQYWFSEQVLDPHKHFFNVIFSDPHLSKQLPTLNAIKILSFFVSRINCFTLSGSFIFPKFISKSLLE